MNRRELVEAVAAHAEVDRATAEKVIGATTEVITAAVAGGDDVVITGWAKFARIRRGARTGRNPRTGEPVKIKASNAAKITPGKTLKDAVSGAAKPPKLGTGTTAKKTAAKKAAPAKKATSSAPAKKTAAKKAAPAKKTAAKKTAAKKAAPAKKTAAKKVAPAKRAPAKKAAAKTTARKAPASRAAAKKAPAKRGAAKRR